MFGKKMEMNKLKREYEERITDLEISIREKDSQIVMQKEHIENTDK